MVFINIFILIFFNIYIFFLIGVFLNSAEKMEPKKTPPVVHTMNRQSSAYIFRIAITTLGGTLLFRGAATAP